MRSTRCRTRPFPDPADSVMYRNWDIPPCGAHVLAQRSFLPTESGVALPAMRDSPTTRRMTLQALLALGGGLLSAIGLRRTQHRHARARRHRRSRRLAGRSRTAVRRADAPRSHRPRDDARSWSTARVRSASSSTPAPAARRSRRISRARSNLKTSVGRNVMLNGVTGAAEVPTVAVDSIEIGALKFDEAEPAGHLHVDHGQCRRHPRRRRLQGPAHRRRLQARPRERARPRTAAGLTTAW